MPTLGEVTKTLAVKRKAAYHSVSPPTGGSLRVFKQFAWLQAGSGKMALSRPAHLRATLAGG
jgi:hypothetical protein